EDVNSCMNVVPEQAEVQLSNKFLQDQQSASLAQSSNSEPAGSSNSSPSSDADKTVSLGLAVIDQAMDQAGKSTPLNQEATSFDDVTYVLSAIDHFLDTNPSQSVVVFDS
ncbi:hypothetical protein A2U01_0058319, partial [Trifolium medium]|nr:hypothetical protein [Trifolium medium]